MAKPRDFEYRFRERRTGREDFPVEVEVEKHLPGQPALKALSTCTVLCSADGRFAGSCPSARYGGNDGRCKHAVMADEYLELRAAVFGEGDYVYLTSDERFKKEESDAA